MIPYVRMRLRFVVRIRTKQTESVHVTIQNVSAHESDKKFQGVTSLHMCFPNFLKWRKGISENVYIPYLSSMIETCRRKITTNGSSRSCRRRTSPHPAVVHELDDCMHHIDVVNLPTVPSASPGFGFTPSRRKRLLRACILLIYLMYYYF